MKTYLDETAGEHRPERRKAERFPTTQPEAELFNGFHNLRENARTAGDAYGMAYITAMMVAFHRYTETK